MSTQDLKNVVNAVCDDYRDQLNDDLRRTEEMIVLSCNINGFRSAKLRPSSFLADSTKALEIVHKLNTVEVLRLFLTEAIQDSEAEGLLTQQQKVEEAIEGADHLRVMQREGELE